MKPIPSGRVAPNPNPFILKATVAALAAVGALSSASVWAQAADAAPAAVETSGASGAEATGTAVADAAPASVVTVTGIRSAARNAQAFKQNNEQVVDSIVADDIGKFPDKNVAEILGRITGVQIIREAGEAGNVVIRGLPGAVTLLNGREMFSAVSRSLFLADIPTTMLSRLDVYKSQGVDMVEGGTAGVIDVRTNRPFDFKGYTASLVGRAENRDKSSATDPQLSGMASNRWKTAYGEFGALVGYSYQRGRYQDEGAWVGVPLSIERGLTGPDTIGRVMTGGDRKRWAGNGVLQWRPNSDVEVFAEVINTRIEHDAQTNFLVGQLPLNKGATMTTVPGTNYLQSISKEGADQWTLTSTQGRRHYSRTTQAATGATWDVNEQWRLKTELARTISKFRNQNPIVDIVGYMPNVSGSIDNGVGSIDYPGGDIAGGSRFFLEKFFDQHSHDEGSSTDWRADAIYTPADKGFFRGFAGGVRIAKRRAASIHGIEGSVNHPGAYSPNQVMINSIPGFTCPSLSPAGNYGAATFAVPCASYLLNNTSDLRQAFTGSTTPNPEDPLSYYADIEKTQALYGKADIAFDAWSVPVDGSVGVRAVRTEQDLRGNSLINNAVVAASTKTTSTDYLPNLALRAKLREDLQARFTWVKATQRPAFADFNPGLVLHAAGNTTLATGTSGNPNLKPIESKNMDVALEWYFAPTGSVTGTVFSHEFKNYIRRKSTPETYDGITYDVSRPYNTSEGKLEGIEIAYKQFYDWLPGWLGGFGLEANGTYMHGGLTEPDGKVNSFAGMSKWAYNLIGLYERGDWSARVAYNWRSRFVSEYAYRATQYDLVVDPMKSLDASITYKLTKNLSLTVDGTNLTDFKYKDYHSEPALARDIRRYDRTIGVALRWKN
ncbi:TonB-dependent receptor [Pseudoduganella chitinolytica]|uniref:TonB-dependent receptor n=1 Tax=Pseudoduganella chitinolytica TaxID=34070 RepID=A0ABY8BET0_9BURK|nr:TonB-dependent receptor [Pseudoduganella chitinolytica]WEF33908.1 TonB-dependent receptor [Pseudoduganella chitinolytica]